MRRDKPVDNWNCELEIAGSNCEVDVGGAGPVDAQDNAIRRALEQGRLKVDCEPDSFWHSTSSVDLDV